MPYDTALADRIARHFSTRGVAFVAKPMMGGLVFMVDDKMCAGIAKDQLLVRLDPAEMAASLAEPGCGPMEFTGRRMKSFVLVEQKAIAGAPALARWLDRALAFNPRAVRSARPKKKRA